MCKSRFTEAQIVGIIKDSEAGGNTAELCRRHGISQTTFYKWKAKFGGMEASDVGKMRALERREPPAQASARGFAARDRRAQGHR